MPFLRIPLVGSFVDRNANPGSFTSSDQRFTNCYPEIVRNPVTGQAKVYLNKRVGHQISGALSGVTSAGVVGAICSWSGNTAPQPPVPGAFINTGGTSTSVWDLANDSKIGGDISTTSDCIALTETNISGTATLIGHFINSGTNVVEQWYFPQAGAWTKVTSNFPSNAVGVPVSMDGYVFTLAQDAKLWNSDLNTIATVGASSYLTAQSMPDKGVSAARYKNYIVAFGEASIEFFYNAGNAVGSPLSSVKDSTVQMGAARRTSHQTILQAADTVYFFATGRGSEAMGIYRLNGTAPEKVSTPAIDKACAEGSLAGFVGTAIFHGQLNILVQGTLGVWAFCPATGFWWKLALAAGEIIYALAVSNVGGGPEGTTYFVGSNNARSNQFIGIGSPLYQDNGSAYTATVRTEPLDVGTNNYKYWDELRIVADTQASTSNLGVQWSDDDYATTSSVRNIDLSTTANNLTRLGRARRRSYTLTHSANTPFRAERLDLRYRLGTS